MVKILTVDEVAKLLHFSKITIYKYAERGKIPSFKIGTNLRFREDEISRFVAACSPPQPPPSAQEKSSKA